MRGLALFTVLGLAMPLAAAAKWVRIVSPNFELYTDAGERAGTETAARLEQIHQVFRGFDRTGRGSPIPVRVFLYRSEGDFRILRSTETTMGFFQSGPQRNYIVLRSAGPSTIRAAFHEYVHLILNHFSARLPRWLEEGAAEFYSTLEADRGRLVIGRPITEHLRTLRTSEWISASEFQSVEQDSPYYNQRGKVGVFYAQSWALTHMLNLSPRYRERMPEFAALLDNAVPASGAFEKAFGRTVADALVELRAYLAGGMLPVLEIGQAAAQADVIPAAVGLSKLEADLARAELMLHSGKKDAAAKIYRSLERQYPAAPEVAAGLGILALSRREYEEARRRLITAVELDSKDPQTWFEYAMLLRDTGADSAAVAAHLSKAVELNPKFAEAHFVLGNMLSAEGRHPEAARHLSQAAAILPRQAYIWRALALAYHNLSDPASARNAAYRALQTAVNSQETEMAQAALLLIDAKPQPAPPKRAEVTTPESWLPRQADAHADGLLIRIDCLEQAARFWVRTDRRTFALYVRNPGEVLLKNLSSVTFEFRCGPQKPRLVSIEYAARPDAALGTDGDVVAIEFR